MTGQVKNTDFLGWIQDPISYISLLPCHATDGTLGAAGVKKGKAAHQWRQDSATTSPR